MPPRNTPARFRFQPRVSELEGRDVPATLNLVGTTLTLTLDAGAAAGVSGGVGATVFDAGAGNTVTANAGAQGLGFTTGAQTSGPGDLTTVTQLDIVGAGGVESFAITATGAFPAFSVAATVETTTLNTAVLTTGTNPQTYNGPVALTGTSQLTGGAISFNSTVDGAFDLNLTSTAAVFVGAVGGTTPLTGLNVGTDTLTAAAVATTGGLNVTNAAAGSVTGVVSGAGGVTKNGAGTLTLGGANTYTGLTNVNGGIVVVANAAALGTTAGATFLGTGATLDVQADIGAEPIGVFFGSIITSGAGTGTIGGPITMFDDMTVGGDGTLNINGVISGAFAVNKTGTGFTTLGGANTYTGATNVTAGTVVVTSAAGLGTADGATVVTAGAVLNVRTNIGTEPLSIAGTGVAGNGALRTSTGFTGVVGGPVTLTAGASIGNGTGAGGGILTINGVIGGAFPLSFTGQGTTILTAANTYTGATTVTSGTVLVNGSLAAAGAVSVTGGMLGGNGTVGALTGATGGTVAPAAGAAAAVTLKAGDTALGAGSTFAPAIAATAGAATGTLAVTGTVNVTGATLAPTLVGAALTPGQSVTIIDNDGTDAVTGMFAGLPQGSQITIGGQQFVISYTGGTGNDVTLTPAPLPPVVVGGSTNGQFQTVATGTGGQLGTPAAVTAFAGSTANVRSTTGDVNGDGTPDIIAVTGPGTPIRVTVLSGVDNSVLVAPFAPFAGSEDFTGGGFVAAGDLDGDGRAEFVVTPDQGGGPRVTIFNVAAGATTATVRANFLGIDDKDFRGGARPALGDVNGDGTLDLAVGAGFLGGPRVALFNGTSLLGGTPTRLINDFFAFTGPDVATLRNGVFLAASDLNGDGRDDLIFGGGPGGAPRVFGLSGALIAANNVDGAQAAPLANFFVAGNDKDRGGVRLAYADLDGDLRGDLVVGSGEGSAARVRAYLGVNVTSAAEPTTFQDVTVFDGATLPGGVFVG